MVMRGLVLRDSNGLPHPDKFRVDPHFGELFIDDATGFVSAATPTNEKVDATPVLVGQLYGITADAAERAATTLGQLNITRAGEYEVSAHGTGLGGNASVMKVEVFLNGAVIADAAASPGGSAKCEFKMQATAAQESWAIPKFRLRGLKKADTLDLRVTGSVGTFTIKQMRFNATQVGDADPAVLV